MTLLGLSLGYAPLRRGQYIRQTTVGAIGAVIAMAILALLRPGAIHVWSIGVGVALAVGWGYLSDCGHTWSKLDFRRRMAATLFLTAAGAVGMAAGWLVQRLAN